MMPKRRLINGLACGAFAAVGIGALAWGQVAEQPMSVANGPLSLPSFPAESEATLESSARQGNGVTRQPGPVLASPLLRTHSGQPFRPDVEQPTRSVGDIVLTDSTAPLKAPVFPSLETSATSNNALRLPTLTADGRAQGVSTAAPSHTPGLDLTDQPNRPAVSDDNVLTLPTLRIAADTPPPVPSDLMGEGPTFELNDVEAGSPVSGPRSDWDESALFAPEPTDTVANDAGLLVDKPVAVPLLAPPAVSSDDLLSNAASVLPSALSGDPALAPYEQRLQRFAMTDEPVEDDVLFAGPSTLPPGYDPWWNGMVAEPLRPKLTSRNVNVSSLTLTALQHSPDILAFQLDPEIERKSIVEEQAAFDWAAFAETTYDDVSDPVGNALTTGGDDRFKDRIWSGTAGLRNRNEHGGEFEISQRLGYQDNNSDFFTPTQQGTSRLTLSYTQPLMNGRGKTYQQSRTVLAMLDTGATEDATADRIQDHLLDVTGAYWDLYRARALYIQRRNLLREADRILGTLEGRSSVDAVPRQILRARSAVSSRRSDMVRSAMEIRNAESRLRLLVGDPEMTSGLPLELLPGETPLLNELSVSMADAARTAMAHRPDIRRGVKKVRATGVRVGVAENELMPRLDVVFNGYLSGLEGQSAVFRSWGDQFSEGRPSFALGLLFEVPLGNRVAKARRHRRQLELVQATHELEAIVETGLTEVEMAVREAETSYREMVSRFESMHATGEEMDYLRDRWDLLPGGSSTTQLLEDLLDAQERLADDEAAFVAAQVNYVLASATLRRAMGTLLEVSSPSGPGSPLAHEFVHLPPEPEPQP